MNEIDRINYLINTLAYGNARRFADACALRADSLSRVRRGHGKPQFIFTNILNAFPDVRPEWLLNGEGAPFYSQLSKDDLAAKLDALTAEVRNLSELLKSALKKP